MSISINKVLLTYSHAISYVYGSFHTTVVELNSYNKDSMAHTAENIYYLVLCRKSLSATALVHHSWSTVWMVPPGVVELRGPGSRSTHFEWWLRITVWRGMDGITWPLGFFRNVVWAQSCLVRTKPGCPPGFKPPALGCWGAGCGGHCGLPI